MRNYLTFLLGLALLGFVEVSLGCSSDSQYDGPLLIAYAAHDDEFGFIRIYTSAPDGSSHHMVSGGLTATPNQLGRHAWRPGRPQLSFVGQEPQHDELRQLQLTEADGTGMRPISRSEGEPDYVHLSAWSPDGTRIAYQAWVDSLGTNEVYVCTADDSVCTKASGEVEESGGAWLVGWSPDGRRLAYVERKDETYPQELFTCAPDGSDKRRVSRDLQDGSHVDPPGVSWSPDGRWLAYVAYQPTYGLYVGAADGSSNYRVSSDVGWRVEVFRWSPDGSRIAFNEFQPGRVDLFTNLPDGSDPVRVTADLGTSAFVFDFRWSPDGTRFAYLGEDDTTDPEAWVELHTCMADGSGHQTVQEGGRVFDFEWSPSGHRLAFIWQGEPPASSELFTCAPRGDDVIKVNDSIGAMPAGGGVASFTWNPDGSRLAYYALRDPFAESGLFTARPDGDDNSAIGLRWEFAAPYAWSPDGSRIAYVVGTESTDSRNQPAIFTSSKDGSDEHRVSDPNEPLRRIWSFAWNGSPASH